MEKGEDKVNKTGLNAIKSFQFIILLFHIRKKYESNLRFQSSTA